MLLSGQYSVKNSLIQISSSTNKSFVSPGDAQEHLPSPSPMLTETLETLETLGPELD